MFAVDPSFTHVAASRDKVLVLVQSINAISVKVPGHEPGPATAYIVGWDVGDANASAIIYLHYTDSHKAVAYVPSPAVFSITSLPQVTEEATEFLESMGFMLDDSAFGTLVKEQQLKVLGHTPVFHADLKKFALARESEDIPDADIVELEPATEVEATHGDASDAASPTTKAGHGAVSGSKLDRDAVGRLLMSF